MTYRDAKRGAAMAGAMLLALPVLDLAMGVANAGVTHFVVGAFGAALIALSAMWR
jgi:hypothetical protein